MTRDDGGRDLRWPAGSGSSLPGPVAAASVRARHVSLWGHFLPLVLALGVAVVAVGPALAVAGLVATRAGGDSPFLLQRTYSMAELLRAGEFPPRWMPEAAYGLGYPFWNYYGPLAYLWAGLLAVGAGSVVGAAKVAALTTFLVGAAGMYALAWRTWRRRAAAFVAAVAYTLAPYHLVNLYVRGDALGELAGAMCLPWVLLAVDTVAERRSIDGTLGLALAAAALLLSHNVTVLLFAPVLAGYVLWRCLRPAGDSSPSANALARANRWRLPAAGPAPLNGARWRVLQLPYLASRAVVWQLERRLWPLRRWDRPWRAVAVGLGLGLGVLLAAWFWLPALVERSAVQLDANLTGYFDYHNHFRGWDLVQWQPRFSYRTGDTATLAPCRLGLLQLLLAAFGLLAARRDRRCRGSVRFWSAVAGLAVLMMTPLSKPIWEWPLLSGWLAFAQFPWRWLSIASLALAMLTGGLGRMVYGWPVALVCAGALGLANLSALEVVPLPVNRVTSADLLAFEVFSGNIGSTVRAEYLPQRVVPRPWTAAAVLFGTAGEPVAVHGRLAWSQRVSSRGTREEWSVSVDQMDAALVAFPRLWFPGYEAQLDGGRWRPVTYVPGSGWLQLEVPPGQHTVRLRLGRSPVRAIAEGLSLAAWLVWLATLLASRQRRWVAGTAAVASVVGLAMLLAGRLPVGRASGPVTLDFAQMPYPHYNPQGVRFGPARLIDGAIGGTQPVPAGEGVAVSLRWQNGSPGWRLEVALVLPPAVNPELAAPDVRTVTERALAEDMSLVLPVPRDAPSGMYFVRLRLRNGSATIVATDEVGRELGDVYLGPVRIRGGDSFWDASGRPVALIGALTLLAVQPVQRGDQLEVRSVWGSTAPMARNYKTSVRLTAADGRLIAQRDAEFLYGHFPTTAWPVGRQLADRRWLSLPPGTSAGEDYGITIVVYDEASGEELGRGAVSSVRLEAVPTAVAEAKG